MLFYKILRVIVLGFLLCLPLPLMGQEERFGCVIDSTSPPAPAAPSTGVAKGVALYATWDSTTHSKRDSLPQWWKDIWDSTHHPSVPKFYKDNSLNQYSLQVTPYGRDTILCFTSSIYPDTGDMRNGGETFTRDILEQADEIINFADYDADGDNVVDAVFLVIVNMGLAYDRGSSLSAEFLTNDSNQTGRKRILGGYGRPGGNGIGNFESNEAGAVFGLSHEWGHCLGVGGDYYGDGGNNWWGLGGFSIMGTGIPFGQGAVPFDPNNRIRLGWVTPTEITAPLYQQIIPDYLTTGAVYKLTIKATQPKEYFLITNHRGVDPQADGRGLWENGFAGHGLVIWHIDSSGRADYFGHKLIDVEAAHGLFIMNSLCQTLGENRYYGRDSLDVTNCIPPGNSTAPCIRYGYSSNRVQSGRCFWNPFSKVNFDGLSNPSSDGYKDSIVSDTAWPGFQVRVQSIPTHLAVKNISAALFQSDTADLLVNNWYGTISQNTTWGPGVYAITDTVTVNHGVTLTTSPGTTIKVNPGKKLIVKGTFTCLGGGNPSDSIIFTSSAATPASGDWGGISVDSLGRAKFEFTRFSYGDTALNVHADTATVRVRNSTFNYFKSMAVFSKSAKTNLGGQVPEPLNPDCGKNNIFMNTADSGAKAVIKTASPSGTLKAEMNWWGQNPPSSSWFSGLNVDYTNWLAGPATPDTCALSGEEPEEEGPNPKISAVQSRLVAFELKQNYPNPFNPTTTIQYALPEAAKVELKVLNILGQVVRTLVDEEKEAGYYQAVWDGKDEAGRPVSSGVYIYKIQAGDFVETKKMQLVK